MIRSALNRITVLVALSIAMPAIAQELPIPVADLQRTEPVDFANDIAPILKRNCLACHHEKEAEGGLVLESAQSIQTGGDGGSSVDLQDVSASLLLLRATGAEEPLMPPEDNAVGANPLTPDELGLLKLWIEQGAKGSDAMSESIQWQEIPESVRTSLALAVAPDGQMAALGRGNRVVIVDLATGQPSGFLIDPEVPGDNAAHVDLVQSIASSPDAQRIATGGFRSVKIWRKEPVHANPKAAPLANSGGLVAVKSDQSAAAIVNAIGDIEVWDLNESQRLSSLHGHTDRVAGIAWSASGNQLASCDGSGRVILWKTETGEKACEIETGAVLTDLAVSDDGQQLAAIDLAGKLHRFQVQADLAGIDPIAEVPEGITQATDILFASKPNPLLVVSDQAAGVWVISLADNQVVRKLDHGAAVDALAISTDQTRLLTGGRDGVTRVWDLASGEAKSTLQGDPQGQLQLLYAQRQSERQKQTVDRLNGETAELEKRLTSENEGLAKTREEQEKADTQLKENEKKLADAVALVATTEQSITKATEDAAKANMAIETAKEKLASSMSLMDSLGKEVESKTVELVSANKEVENVKTQLAAVTKMLEEADAKAKQIQKLIDEKNGDLVKAKEAVASAQKEIESATKLSNDSKAMAEKATKDLEQQKKDLASTEEAKKNSEAELAKRKQAFDTATQAQIRAEAAIPKHKAMIESETRRLSLLDQLRTETEQRLADPNRQILAVAVNSSDDLVATSHRDGVVRVYRLNSGEPVARFESKATAWNPARRVAWFGSDVVTSDDRASSEVFSTSVAWTLERTIGSLDDPTTISDRVTALCFRQDGMSIAVASGPPSRSGEVKVFAVDTGQLVRDFGEIHSDTVLGLAFSPDSRMIASSAADKTIRLLDIATGQVTRSLEGHTHHVLSIAWQDDGRSIASASADRTVKIWDAETGEQRRTISGFGKEITALQFVAATNQLATACADGQVRLYDVSNGKAIRTFNASGDFLFALGVSVDGKTLLASGQSGVLRVWNVEDAKLLHELK